MDIPALIHEALRRLRIDQAGLARRMGRGEPTVSRWLSGASKPDYESCLRLSQITGTPAPVVLEAAGLDPTLLPPNPDVVAKLSPFELDVRQRTARIQAAVDATEGLPDDFVDVYLRKVLDNTEEEITATIRMVREMRAAAAAEAERARARRIRPTTAPPSVTKPAAPLGRDNDDEVAYCEEALPVRQLAAAVGRSDVVVMARGGLHPVAIG